MSNTKRQIFTPKIVTFVCNWCSSASGDLVGPIRTPYRGIPRVMRVLCTGRIQADDIIASFEMGADGIMIAGCEELECNYRTGNIIARRRVRFVKAILKINAMANELEKLCDLIGLTNIQYTLSQIGELTLKSVCTSQSLYV